MTTEGASDHQPSDHPAVLSPVSLRVSLPEGGAIELPSRVSDVETGPGDTITVTVARPDLSGLPEAGTFPHRDQEVLLSWPHDNGRMLVPATAVAAQRPYGPVWVLTITGRPERVQRRDFFRVPLTQPVQVRLRGTAGAEDEPAVLRGTLVDLSEGGALTLLAGDLPDAGTLVDVALQLDGQELAPEAEVVRQMSFPSGDRGLALRFTDPDRYGDLIRKVAFAEQRRLAGRR